MTTIDKLAPSHASGGTHSRSAGGKEGSDQHKSDSQMEGVAALLELSLAAENLSDIERTRIAIGNRLDAMGREGLAGEPEYHQQELIMAAMEGAEKLAIGQLRRSLRKHPLGPWIQATVGLGEKQGARLIAAIGDPAWNDLDDRPRRGPAELWAYCGYAPGQKRQKGVKSNWNAEAKMRARLCAESCIKQRHSPYREVYDDARSKWAAKDVTDLHAHNHALRVVAKAILRDLWSASRAAA